MANTIQEAAGDVAAALASFVTAKKASTNLLTALVNQFNTGTSIAIQKTTLSAYVSKFNELTTLSDALRVAVAAMQDMANAQVIALTNLTDPQVESMRANAQQYFAAGYLALTNCLLFFPQDKALTIIELVHTDLINDVNNAWADFAAGVTPDPPRVSVAFDSGNVLDIVDAALREATPADAEVGVSLIAGHASVN